MKVAVIIPNWNGSGIIGDCLNSLQAQTINHHVIVVENGSTDNSFDLINKNYPEVEILASQKNLGFAGGVNAGIVRALESGFEFIALLNNDAIVDKKWLERLVDAIERNQAAGVVTSKILSGDKKLTDSTGEQFTIWGMSYPRDRDVPAENAHDKPDEVFGASGGASIYRASMLREIGLFDEDFFAYYEDVDLSFRAQLASWKVLYEPKAIAYHSTGATSGSIKGFTTYQTFKNSPWLLWKNVPLSLFPGIFLRFSLVYLLLYGNSLLRGRGWSATKGVLRMLLLLPKKIVERRQIQNSRKVPVEYIRSMLVRDLPPGVKKVRLLRSLNSKK